MRVPRRTCIFEVFCYLKSSNSIYLYVLSIFYFENYPLEYNVCHTGNTCTLRGSTPLNGPCISSPRTIDWHIAMNEYRHNRPLCFHLHHNCQDLDRNH
jgi:hypothetical protein